MSIKGLDDHITAGQPEQPDPEHYHVSRHSNDDDVAIFTDFWTALDYAATELRELAEFEYEGISASGDAGDFESAYEAFVHSNELDNHHNNVVHVIKQHEATDPDEGEAYDPAKHRAPHWQGYGGDERIMRRALAVAQTVNFETSLKISACFAELIYLTDTGQLSDEDNGIPYHADEYVPSPHLEYLARPAESGNL